MANVFGARQALIAVAAWLVALVVLPFVLDYYTLTVLVIYGMLAISLGLIWGFGGILSFGQAAFYGLGAYTYAIAAVNFGESTVPFVLAILVPAAFAAILGAMMFYGRLSDVYLGVITLVVTLIFYKFMNQSAGEEFVIGTARLGGYNGIPGFQTLNVPGDPDAFLFEESLYYVCAVLLALVYLLCRWLVSGSFGRVAIGIRENELRSELMGYDVRLYKTGLFAIGGAIAGLAGCLYASWAEIVTPNLFSLGQSAEIIMWVIVGGRGTLIGPVIGAAAIGLIKFYLGQQALIDNLFVMGVILVATVLLLPRGLVPALGRLGGRLTLPARVGGASPARGRRTRGRRRIRHAG